MKLCSITSRAGVFIAGLGQLCISTTEASSKTYLSHPLGNLKRLHIRLATRKAEGSRLLDGGLPPKQPKIRLFGRAKDMGGVSIRLEADSQDLILWSPDTQEALEGLFISTASDGMPLEAQPLAFCQHQSNRFSLQVKKCWQEAYRNLLFSKAALKIFADMSQSNPYIFS